MAQRRVVLVGTLKALAIAVKNMDARRRVTPLRQWMEGAGGANDQIEMLAVAPRKLH